MDLVRKRQAGWTLVEIMVVVAIIAVLCGIAVPSVLKTLATARESGGMATLRAVGVAQTAYVATYGQGYGNLTQLSGPAACVSAASASCLLDSQVGTGIKGGFTITVVPNTGNGTAVSPFLGYEATAIRTSPSQAQRSFCTDQTGVIRYNMTGAVISTTVGSCSSSGLPSIQ